MDDGKCPVGNADKEFKRGCSGCARGVRLSSATNNCVDDGSMARESRIMKRLGIVDTPPPVGM